MKKAVFLDRDGVINENHKPVNTPEDLKLYPWVVSAIEKLKDAGYYVFVVTNQGGIELGYFTEEDLNLIHDKLIRDMESINNAIKELYLNKANGKIDKSSWKVIILLLKNIQILNVNDISAKRLIGSPIF